jgi:hypothetical protein
MRATAGSVSARFQTLRLPRGRRARRLVAQTRRPYWTADYPADERYRHTTEIDAAVGEEGLVAICGTPLLVDGQFVGVLFAANRTRRPFRRDEVALLGSLAALAAVSLVQTRRSAETAAALAALSTAHEGIAQAATAHDRFTEVVLGGGGVDAIAAALGELLDCWVAVLDADGARLAGHGAVPDVVDPRSTGRLVHADGQWSVAVTAVGQRLGTLVLGGRDELDEGQGRTVERAAMVTALVLLFRLRAAEADHRVRADLLADLLRATAPDRALVERGRLLGLRLREPHVVVVCRGERPPRAAAGRVPGGRGRRALRGARRRRGGARAGPRPVRRRARAGRVRRDGRHRRTDRARRRRRPGVRRGPHGRRCTGGARPRGPRRRTGRPGLRGAHRGRLRRPPTSTPTSRACSARSSTTTPPAAPSS